MRAKYEAKSGIFSRITLSGGRRHHFLQDSAHIFKICEVYQTMHKIVQSQNRRILVGLILPDVCLMAHGRLSIRHFPH